MVDELKWIRKSSSLIRGIPGTASWCLIRRLCLVSMLGTGTLIVHPAAVATQPDNPARTGVQRVPDTWEVTATEDSIYFNQESSSIGEEATATIRRHAAKLRGMPGLQITLIAHTGDLGSSSLELARGEDRLEAVRKRLEGLKVPPGRIRTENQGSENRNAEPCVDDECRNRNRRVDILFHR